MMRMHVEMIAGQRVSARVVAAGGAPARRPPAGLPVRQSPYKTDNITISAIWTMKEETLKLLI